MKEMTTRNRLAAVLVLGLLLMGCVVASGAQTYTVRPGDTLAQIAQAHDTTVERLVELNKETYPSLATDPGAIEVGWTLQVPGRAVTVPVKVIVKTPEAEVQPTAAMERDAFELEVVRLVNEERVKAGLAPLEADPGLMQFARERSEDMIARGYFSHYDPTTGEDLSGAAGENIARFSSRWDIPSGLPQRSVSYWIASEDHRKNILDAGAHKTGVGVAVGNDNIIITQLFAE